MFAMAKLTEMETTDQNQVALFLFNDVNVQIAKEKSLHIFVLKFWELTTAMRTLPLQVLSSNSIVLLLL